MMKILARKLLNFTTDQLWEILTGTFVLVFDNGEIETNWKETVYSSYFWDFHRLFPQTPMLINHHVQPFLKKEGLNSRTHILLLGSIFRDLMKTYRVQDGFDREALSRRIYQITNTLYNDLSYRIEDHVVSIDLLDFIEVTSHPVVDKAMDEIEPTADGIARTYDIIMDVIMNDKTLDNNALVRSTRSGAVRASQVLQCVGPRGFLNDIDSTTFPHPILRGYVHTIRTLHDSMIESRSAARSLFFSKAQLEDAEYFARRLQLQTMVVENIHYGDCGSDQYVHWVIKPPEMNEKGETTYPGDLPFLIGKFYLDEETNTLKAVDKNDKHLIGTTIKMRSPVAGCWHPDPHGICSVCFGELTDNLPPDTNAGHNCSATTTRSTTQSILSTKHEEKSSTSEAIVLSEEGLKFFSPGSDNLSLSMKPWLKNHNPILSVPRGGFPGLMDILRTENIDAANLFRVSAMEMVAVQFEKNGVISDTALTVGLEYRKVSFSRDFLRYIQKVGVETPTPDKFTIPLSDWDFSQPMFTLPFKQYSMSMHSKTVATLIESKMEKLTERKRPDSPVNTLGELFDLINRRLRVNIALLEVIVYGGMIRSFDTEDYRLPKKGDKASLSTTTLIIRNRSLSAQMAFQAQASTMLSPSSFLDKGRANSIMDVFIKPFEVVQENKKP